MSAVDEVKFSIRTVINKEKSKVLFAVVDSDFADVLLSFLTLPLGMIVRILENHYRSSETPVKIGSLNSLRKGLAELDDVHFWTKECKTMLLNPVRCSETECGGLKMNTDPDAQRIKYFACENLDCLRRPYRQENVSMYFDNRTCICGKSMNREVGLQANHYGLFTIEKIQYLISDELCLVPNVTGSVMQTLANLGISNMDGAEQRTVTLGFNEIMDLLRGSLLSKTPLTDIVLRKRGIFSPTVPNFSNLVHDQLVKDASYSKSDKTMIVKVMIQKSTNKLLFAQAEEDFVDFLFSFLTIPLGTVVHLLDGKTCLNSIDNLHRSIANIDGQKYLKSPCLKNRLLKPEIPPMFLSKNQFFPLIEQSTPLYYIQRDKQHSGYFSMDKNYIDPSFQVKFKDPKGEKGYVKGPRMFMIGDDLNVTPLCILSSFSILNELGISLSDVKEVELHIGLEEALSILRASLTSTRALTNGLINHIPMKQLNKSTEADRREVSGTRGIS